MTDTNRIVLPLAALLAISGALGLMWGLRSVPPGDTEIIEAVAAAFVAETGGEMTDCFARPGPSADIRMVVTCAAPDAPPWQRAVDPMGRIIDPSDIEAAHSPLS